MKTGVLFDSCTVQEVTSTMHPLYQIGESLHSLVSSLSPDPIIDNYDLFDDWFALFFSFTDREERFASLLSSLQQDYHSQYSFPALHSQILFSSSHVYQSTSTSQLVFSSSQLFTASYLVPHGSGQCLLLPGSGLFSLF